MKTILFATILFLPCLLVLNESETFIPNLIGIGYICTLAKLATTNIGKRFIKKLYRENERITNKFLK